MDDDTSIIEFLCDDVFPMYSLNKEVLLNWKVELDLVDFQIDDLLLSNNIYSHNYNYSLHFEELINRILDLGDHFNDFKVIILELTNYLISTLYKVKLGLFQVRFHTFLIDKFLGLLEFIDSLILEQLSQLILSFLELGCDIEYFQKLVTGLFGHIGTTSKIVLLDLLHRLFIKYPSHFRFTIFNKVSTFALQETLIRKFSIQLWFKVNPSDGSETTLFVLSNSETSDELRIKLINYNQFVVEIGGVNFKFNQKLRGELRFTHFVLTYDNYSNLNLFIDGEYSESIPCPELHKLSGWNKVYLGNEVNNEEILVKNLTILNTSLSHEWVYLLYNLGVGYDWECKEFTNENLINLLTHLNFKNLVNVSTKFTELRNKKWSVKDQEPRARKANNVDVIDKELMISSLTRLKQENVMFDTNDFYLQLERKSQRTDQKVDYSYNFHNLYSLHGALYSIGGTTLLLGFIESTLEISDPTLRDTSLYLSISLLFTIINNNWRLCKEFENINGYAMLSILLTNYKDKHNKSFNLNLSSKYENTNLLNLILKHSGYDFGTPYESTIINPLSYRLIVLNFDLFYETDCFELLLYHFQILIYGSRNEKFNTVELGKMKLLRKFIQFLKQTPKAYVLRLELEVWESQDPSQHLDREPVLPDSQELEDQELELNGLALQNLHLTLQPKLASLKQDPKSKLASPSLFSLPLLQSQLSLTLTAIIRAEASVETIRAVSLYVIYALYNEECSTECGITILRSLTEVLCDPNSSIKTLKKFSRSITIHWILLLFNFNSKEVVKCGIRLLSKLLRVLGPHIIKRFFEVNHGLDILTHFLNQWWHDDEILSCILLAGFGESDVDNTNADMTSILKSRHLNLLVMPDFMILLNNLVLNSMYTLSLRQGRLLSNPSSPARSRNSVQNLTLSLDVLHLMNEYSDVISLGFENKALKLYFFSKDFLDGAFEILGYLKIAGNDFKSTFNKFVKVLADIFIASFTTDTFNNLVDSLNPFTKTLIYDSIFPRIFDHINQFVNVSNFIFNERKFLDSSLNLVSRYLNEFVKKNYYISQVDLDFFITCTLLLVEVNKNSKLQKELPGLLTLKLAMLGNEDDPFNFKPDAFTNMAKLLLYRQATILQLDCIDHKQVSVLLILIIGNFLPQQEDNTEYVFNFLRTCYLMNQDNFEEIAKNMIPESDLILEFFQFLVTKNDEESLERLQKYPPVIKSIRKHFQILVSRHTETTYLNVSDMIKVSLNNGGNLGYLDNVYIRSFERDCELLKVLIMSGESDKLNRSLQDRQENIQFFLSNYYLLKIEISRLVGNLREEKSYSLDFIENNDRMRNRLIVEDQIPDYEKLSYNITIPVKQVIVDVEDSFDYGILSSGIDTLSLSLEDDFEIVEPVKDNYEDKNRKVIRSLYMGDQIVALWNITQINGLVPVESLMILGINYLYLIENYFHCPDGNVVDVEDAPAEARDPILQLVNNQSSKLNGQKSHFTKSWSLDKLSSISKRHFLLRDIAIEMFFSDGASVLLTCISTRGRDNIYSKLSTFASGRGLDSDLTQVLQMSSPNLQATGSTSFTSKIASAFSNPTPTSNINATKKWKNGEMSNFYYLMIINTLAGRTFNDLTQYPVFPWVIADYTSETLDFSNPKTFRDLSKPMGAQTPVRAKQFKDRYDALASLDDTDSPPFHYGTHYSTAMTVTSFLIRLKPYVQSYLFLQGGKFDHADRLFNSIEKAWNSASKDNTTDVRELTPEFFYLPEFLVNSNNFELGTLQSGESSNDVVLPPWAKGDPKIFIAKNREALESSYVSANLHLWIDLIFGVKQSGMEAERCLNVFHHLSYNGAINLDKVDDEVEKRAIIGMINNFGQTPLKLFSKPHALKEVLNLSNYYLSTLKKAPVQVFESKLKLPIQKLEISFKNGKKWVGRPNCITSEDDLLIRRAAKFDIGSLFINQTTFLSIHQGNITSILLIGHKLFLTGSDDGIINVWKCSLKPSTSLQFQSVLRGHFSEIIQLKFSKSFKVGVSVDKKGVVIIWDFTRFKFIRKITPPKEVIGNTIISISNDTGNIAIVYDLGENHLFIYTLNGDLIYKEAFEGRIGKITSFSFGSINDPMVDTGKNMVYNLHTYWSNETFAVAHDTVVEIYELSANGSHGWDVNLLDHCEFGNALDGSYITALELFNVSEVDSEDKLTRGVLKLVIGDSKGRVFA